MICVLVCVCYDVRPYVLFACRLLSILVAALHVCFVNSSRNDLLYVQDSAQALPVPASFTTTVTASNAGMNHVHLPVQQVSDSRNSTAIGTLFD